MPNWGLYNDLMNDERILPMKLDETTDTKFGSVTLTRGGVYVFHDMVNARTGIHARVEAASLDEATTLLERSVTAGKAFRRR